MASAQIITKSVTLSPGESFTLPSGATVIALTDVLDSSCDLELPDPEPLVDYNFIFSLNQDNEDDHPMGSEVNIDSILINGTSVTLAFTALNTDNSGNIDGVVQWNNEISNNNNLLNSYPVKFVSINFESATSKNDLITVVMKMTESYQSKVFLKITNDKFPNGIYLNGSL